MKKLHSFAFYALVAPAITLGSGALLAEQPTGKDDVLERQGAEHNRVAPESGAETSKSEKKMDGQSGMQNQSKMAGMQNQGFMESAPADGMQASNLIGTDVKTTGDEEVGSVSDLIIDQNGQVVAVIVGVGGFLAMGQKDVAIAWDDVTKSGTSDKQELRIDATREELESAPEFVTQE